MLFLRKISRDLRKNKSRSLPILILIAVSQLAAILYIQVGVMMDASWQQYIQEVDVGDVWIDTVPISTTVFNNSVISQWQQSYSIGGIQPRLYFKGHITIQNEKIPVSIVSLPADNPPAVNRIVTKDESYFSDHSDIKNGVYIEQSYLEFYGLEETDQISLTVNFGIGSKDLNLTNLGGAFSPEYPMKKGEGGSTQQFEFSATFDQYLIMSVFLRIDYLQEELFQGEEIYNQICIFLNDDNEIPAFIHDLQTETSPLYRYIIETRKYPSLIEDMVFIMVGVGFGVAFFFLIISMFLTYTIVSRFIDEQRPQVGVLKSLGYSNRYLLTRNLLYGLILGSIGSVLGNLIGGLIGILAADLALFSWLSFPKLVIVFSILESLLMILITIFCSILACYVSSRRILKITPRAAIMPAFIERKVSTFILEDFLQKIFGIRLSVPSKYSIRNLFTNPKRTLTTIISLLMAVALVGGVFTIVESVFSGGSLMFESENWDAQITLTYPQNFTDVQSNILTQISDKTITLEPMLVDFAKIKDPVETNGLWRRITFISLPINPNLKTFDGANNGFQSDISAIISPDLAQQLELEVGKSYSLIGRNGTLQTVNIQLILPQHHVSSFYIPISLGNYLSFGNNSKEMVNGVLLSSSELTEKDLEALSSNYAVIQKSDLIEQTESWYQLLSSILFGLLFLILFIAGLIIYSIMSISIAERRDDLMIMKAIGIQNRTIYRWGLLEILIYSLIASIGYFIGFYISGWYMGILQSLMQQPQGSFELSFTYYIASLIFGFIAATLGQFIALRYVLKQRIANVTKEMMFG